jgi:hypothetical protein
MRKVNLVFLSYNTVQQNWHHPFNKASFFNYDPNSAVIINRSFIIQPAQVVGGINYPTFLEISLNENEVNQSSLSLDTKGSTSADLRVILTLYAEQ